MIIKKTVGDNLSIEYLSFLPELKKAIEIFVTNIKWYLKPTIFNLNGDQRIEIKFRIKECNSAINSLERREEFKLFDEEDPNKYSLKKLKDLVGVRILVFPSSLVDKVKNILVEEFSDWKSDPVIHNGQTIAWKYHGNIEGSTIEGEFQVVPMLIGLFWEVEHFVFYKPNELWKNITENPEMKDIVEAILDQFKNFEECFEKIRNEVMS